MTVVNVDEHIETDKAKCLDKMATIAEVEINSI